MGKKRSITEGNKDLPKVVYRHKQSEIFDAMNDGKTNEQIMKMFHLSYKRVWELRKNYNANVLDKTSEDYHVK